MARPMRWRSPRWLLVLALAAAGAFHHARSSDVAPHYDEAVVARLSEWLAGGDAPDQYVLNPGTFHRNIEIDLALGVRLYWLEGMLPNSTYEVRVAYTGTSRIRVNLTPAGVFMVGKEIIHVVDHRGQTIKLSDSYQSKINSFAADQDLLRRTRGNRGLAGQDTGAGGAEEGGAETGQAGGADAERGDGAGPGPGSNGGVPSGQGGGATALQGWALPVRMGRSLMDVEKVIFRTDARGGVRGGKPAVILHAARDGVHFSGLSFPTRMEYHIVLMRMAGFLPLDAAMLMLMIVALCLFTIWVTPSWMSRVLPRLEAFVVGEALPGKDKHRAPVLPAVFGGHRPSRWQAT